MKGFERLLGVFHEAQLQHAVLQDRALVRVLDDWYGSTHFLVTAVVLAILFFVYSILLARGRPGRASRLSVRRRTHLATLTLWA